MSPTMIAAIIGVLAVVALAAVLYQIRDGGRSQSLDLGRRLGRLPPGRMLIAAAVVLGAGAGLVWLAVTFLPFAIAVKALAAVGIGIAILPGTAYVLGRSLGPVGMLLGKLYLIMGLLSFDRPVLYLTKDGNQKVVEANELGSDVDITWYRFAKSWLGFAYENDEAAWPGRDTTMKPSSVSELGEAVADGGADVRDSVPAGYLPTTQISYAGHEGVVPKRTNDDTVYVQTHHALRWFGDVGREEILLTALEYAKEKYGHGTPPINERWVMGLSLVMALFGAVFGWWMFF